MKKQLLYSIAVCFASALLFTTSCKEKDDDVVNPEPTTYDLILGSWLATHDATDDNQNGTIEESEKFVLSDSVERFTFTFRSDGTFINKYEDLQDPQFNDEFTANWSLINDNKEVLLISTENNITDSTVAVIVTLNSKHLVLVSRDAQFGDDYIYLEKN